MELTDAAPRYKPITCATCQTETHVCEWCGYYFSCKCVHKCIPDDEPGGCLECAKKDIPFRERMTSIGKTKLPHQCKLEG